jgi:DNA-binding FadR family transcriptional regulator
MFAALDGMIAEVLTSRTRQGLMPFRPLEEALEAHQRVAQSIANGELAEAEASMREVLQEVRSALHLGS